MNIGWVTIFFFLDMDVKCNSVGISKMYCMAHMNRNHILKRSENKNFISI